MAENWNVKKDLLWGLALTVGLIAFFEMWKYIQAQTAAQAAASQADSASNTEAAAGTGLAAQIQNVGTSYGSAGSEGSDPSAAQGVASATAGPNYGATTNISEGAQIGNIDPATLSALFDNLTTVSNPVPLQTTPIDTPLTISGSASNNHQASLVPVSRVQTATISPAANNASTMVH